MKRLLLFVVLAVLALLAGRRMGGLRAGVGSPFATGTDPYGVTRPTSTATVVPDVAVINGIAQSDTSSLSCARRRAASSRRRHDRSRRPVLARTSPLSADFNGDGRSDLAVAKFAGFGFRCRSSIRNPAGGGFTQVESQLGIRRERQRDRSRRLQRRRAHSTSRWHSGTAASSSVYLRQRREQRLRSQEPAYAAGANPRQIAVGRLQRRRPSRPRRHERGGDSVTVLLRNAWARRSSRRATRSPWVRHPRDRRCATSTATDAPTSPSSNCGSNTVQLLLRNARQQRVHATKARCAVPVSRSELAVADFDRNGRTDLAVASETRQSAVHRAVRRHDARAPDHARERVRRRRGRLQRRLARLISPSLRRRPRTQFASFC